MNLSRRGLFTSIGAILAAPKEGLDRLFETSTKQWDIRALYEALEGGNYDAAPTKLTQGCSYTIVDVVCHEAAS